MHAVNDLAAAARDQITLDAAATAIDFDILLNVFDIP